LTENLLTRREIVRSLLLAGSPLAARAVVLENAAVRFEIALTADGTVERSLTNRLTGELIRLRVPDFRLVTDTGQVLSSRDMSAAIVDHTSESIRLEYSKPGGPEVRVDYSLPRDKHYLRKAIAVRWRNGAPGRLMEAELDNWKGVRRNWRSMQADRFRYGSHPIYCDTIWAGVEFVAAFNEYGPDGFVLRSRPGGMPLTSQWTQLNSTVVGVSEPGRVREAFLHYIDDIRLTPPRLVACYNSWWTLPLKIRNTELVALARELKAKLYDSNGVFFDIFTIDEGWANPQSIWQLDFEALPNGLADVRSVVEAAGGKLGLWISPSGVYPRSLDYKWAEKNGLVVLWAGPGHWHRTGVSLADPRYRLRTKQQLQDLIRDYGLAHVKYDGFIAREERVHHDLLAGDDSVEPLARYALELIKASKEANPDLVTEPTFLNSLANYISPWILRYADVVWANAGGDCPRGLGPAPDYREAHTNAREYYIFSSLDEIWLPQNAVQYFDIVHCDPGGGFANHAAMAFGRGRFFIATYVNPLFMTGEDWRIFAGLLRWARANQDLLRNTTVLRSRVERGEPYAYGHWLGSRGLIVVRNPSNESKEYLLELRKTGAPAALEDAVCYTQYPYRRGIAAGLNGKSTLRLKLAPWELLYLEIVPRLKLKEPVVIGGRWYSSGGAVLVAPDFGVDQLMTIEPGGSSRTQVVRPTWPDSLVGSVRRLEVRDLPSYAWFRVGSERAPTVAFEIECEVNVPRQASHGQVLLLLEYPGREHRPSQCQATVNGASIGLRRNSSEGHVGVSPARPDGYGKEAIPYESEWTWYICDVPAGRSVLWLAGTVADPNVRFGLWAWADFDIAARQIILPLAGTPPSLPQYRDQLERHGVCMRTPSEWRR
jgi:hypothetical protein